MSLVKGLFLLSGIMYISEHQNSPKCSHPCPKWQNTVMAQSITSLNFTAEHNIVGLREV